MDRWLELDLYWFDHENISASVAQFWDRFAPLFQGVDGWAGVILSEGFLMDYILDWRGNLDDHMPLPCEVKQQGVWFNEKGPLTGDTEARKKKFKERFSRNVETLDIKYPSWTYGELGKLADAIRQEAASRAGLPPIKIGTSIVGWDTIYEGEKSRWLAKHPDVFSNRAYVPSIGTLKATATLEDDPTAYGAFPHGVRKGMPIAEFFGPQWGSFSKAVGIDALILRDGILGPGTYRRLGPYGTKAPADPQAVSDWTQAVAAFVRNAKKSNPAALLIGYSSGASAVADWRVNCTDLERIAKEGYLDGWIDQTWAGAWNEIGVRGAQTAFWNLPLQGWTYQMAFVLLHAAVLADTKVRHYVLTETWDAWEDWNIIHTAPERLKWGIWAYLHAACKTPKGLKMPAGSYVSWGNRGKQLMSAEDVAFVADNTNAAFHDAARTREVFGPTLVYCRSAMQWQSEHAPDKSIKEFIDEQAGTLMKWTVPIFSSTRIEYLPHIKSELPILQTPVHLQPAEKQAMMDLLKTGRPVVVFGSPAGGVDSSITGLMGIASEDEWSGAMRRTAQLETTRQEYSAGIPRNFSLFQPFSRHRASAENEVIYSVDDSAALLIYNGPGRQVVLWDPTDFVVEPFPAAGSWNDKPLVDLLGSAFPFVLVARVLTDLLKGTQSPHAERIEPRQTICMGAWRLDDGAYRILAGNLEEGLSHDADHSRHVVVIVPAAWPGKTETLAIKEIWHQADVAVEKRQFKIDLQQAQSALYSISLDGEPDWPKGR